MECVAVQGSDFGQSTLIFESWVGPRHMPKVWQGTHKQHQGFDLSFFWDKTFGFSFLCVTFDLK